MLDFLGIGAQKAATTWLFRQLKSHPDIAFPAGKEVHYWDLTPDPDGSAWGKLFEQPSIAKQGEITPAYALLADEQVSIIKGMYPALRVFYSIRNPIERSWAHVRMHHKNGHIALDDIPAILQFCAAPNCADRNAYVATIERWRRIFGTEQFRHIFYDDIVATPQTVLLGLAEHIGVDPGYFSAAKSDMSAKVFAGVDAPMPEPVRAYLTERYEAPIEALGRLLNRDLSSWTLPPRDPTDQTQEGVPPQSDIEPTHRSVTSRLKSLARRWVPGAADRA